jgi:hypothetical protein
MKLSLLALLLVPAAEAAPAAPRKDLIMSDAPFEYAAPAGWSRRPNEDGSVVLVGPADANDVSALITLRHYPPDDPDFAGFDAFVARQSAPPVFKSSPRTEKRPDVSVAGRKAKAFARDGAEFVPPGSRNTKEVPMREELVAVPAKEGFFLLTYYAPKSLHRKHRRAFESVLKSFMPKL